MKTKKCLVNVKVKQSHKTPTEAKGERMYSSYSFKTLALDGVSGQRHTPAVLYPPGKDPWYPLYSRLGGVLATKPKSRGFEPGQGNGFLRVIKIHSTPSFGWEVKPEFPCRKILRHLKDLLKFHGDG
jgi:hypothetical protein